MSESGKKFVLDDIGTGLGADSSFADSLQQIQDTIDTAGAGGKIVLDTDAADQAKYGKPDGVLQDGTSAYHKEDGSRRISVGPDGSVTSGSFADGLQIGSDGNVTPVTGGSVSSSSSFAESLQGLKDRLATAEAGGKIVLGDPSSPTAGAKCNSDFEGAAKCGVGTLDPGVSSQPLAVGSVRLTPEDVNRINDAVGTGATSLGNVPEYGEVFSKGSGGGFGLQ